MEMGKYLNYILNSLLAKRFLFYFTIFILGYVQIFEFCRHNLMLLAYDFGVPNFKHVKYVQ